MKKLTQIIEKKKEQIKNDELVNERNMYLDFAKKYHKKHGVSGPFDEKFKGNKIEQRKYMEGLSKAWEEYKKNKRIKIKKKKDFIKESLNESKAAEMAKKMVGDGGDPNYHFVTMSDDYYFEKDGKMIKYSASPESAPLQIKTTPTIGSYTFGPFLNFDESKLFCESIELDEINGPRMVKIEDRKSGEVFSRYLICKLQPVWAEEEISIKGSENIESEETEELKDPNAEYTYRNEEE